VSLGQVVIHSAHKLVGILREVAAGVLRCGVIDKSENRKSRRVSEKWAIAQATPHLFAGFACTPDKWLPAEARALSCRRSLSWLGP